jgi:hypothetical protein
VPSALDQDDIINDAGRAFYNIHQWNFRYKPPIAISLRANEPFVLLPADFGEMVAYQMTEGINFGIAFTTPQEVATLRSTTITVTQNYYWASTVFPSQVNQHEAPPPPRFEIWPTPSADDANALTLWYRSKWTKLVKAASAGPPVVLDDIADVPEYAEAALIQFVRAFSAGWSERLLEPGGAVEGYLERVMNGKVWEAAVTADNLIQVDHGEMMGGAIQRSYPHTGWRSRSASAVSDPA